MKIYEVFFCLGEDKCDDATRYALLLENPELYNSLRGARVDKRERGVVISQAPGNRKTTWLHCELTVSIVSLTILGSRHPPARVHPLSIFILKN